MSGDLEKYLREVGGLNAKAAVYGALAVTCSTLAGIISALL